MHISQKVNKKSDVIFLNLARASGAKSELFLSSVLKLLKTAQNSTALREILKTILLICTETIMNRRILSRYHCNDPSIILDIEAKNQPSVVNDVACLAFTPDG